MAAAHDPIPRSKASKASTASTDSRTSEKLRAAERERDEFLKERDAFARARDEYAKERDEFAKERDDYARLASRLKEEAGSGPNEAEAELRVLRLKYEALRITAATPARDTTDLFRVSCASDILFLMDTTGSMSSHIKAAKDQVRSIVAGIAENLFNEAEVRMAVVGYKDHEDAPNIQFLDFTPDADKVRSFLDELKATGGKDLPEDVLGGLRKALNLSWKNPNRCIFHIADAPPHGTDLHDLAAARDDYSTPGSEPHGLKHADLLRQMLVIQINYTLLRINGHTDKMAFTFLKAYQQCSPDCKLHPSNSYHSSSYRSVLGPSASAATPSARTGGLQFEEHQLGTDYAKLRHLVVRSVSTSASRTAVRSSGTLTRTSPAKRGSVMTSSLASIVESAGHTPVASVAAPGDSETSAPGATPPLETAPPQWDTAGWLDEELSVEAYSTDVAGAAADGHSLLDDMLASDDNIPINTTDLAVHKRSKPFAQGAVRAAWYARTAASTNQLVVKTFKRRENGLAHIVDEMRVQALCKAFALEFNALAGEGSSLDFLVATCLRVKKTTSSSTGSSSSSSRPPLSHHDPPPPSYRSTAHSRHSSSSPSSSSGRRSHHRRSGSAASDSSSSRHMALEPYISGAYVKYNSNYGWVNDAVSPQSLSDAVQAFSHFTFERSRGQCLVADLQGVGNVLTDPAVHTRDPERFKLTPTNLGAAGFKYFFMTHRCTPVCRRLGLKSKGSMLAAADATASEFREEWPALPSSGSSSSGGSRDSGGTTTTSSATTVAVCCANKFCGRIVRATAARATDKFPGYSWCESCWPQLQTSTAKFVCVDSASSAPHEFEVSRFFYESQGQILPRKCVEHRGESCTREVRRG